MSRSTYTTLAVKVTPRAARDQVVGWCSVEHEEIVIRVRAAAADGKANAALIALLAKELGITKASVRLMRGHTSRHKLLELDIEPAKLADWLDGVGL